jgi:hypothetical protein
VVREASQGTAVAAVVCCWFLRLGRRPISSLDGGLGSLLPRRSLGAETPITKPLRLSINPRNTAPECDNDCYWLFYTLVPSTPPCKPLSQRLHPVFQPCPNLTALLHLGTLCPIDGGLVT